MPKYNEIVQHTCCICGCTKLIQYRPSRFKNWRCKKCADDAQRTKKEKPKAKSHKKPKRVEVICKYCGKKYFLNRRYANRRGDRPCQSCAMYMKWNNEDYRKYLSNVVSINNKKLWEDNEYRDNVTKSNSDTWSNRLEYLSERAKKLWSDPEYKERVLAGMAKPDSKRKLALSIARQSCSQERTLQNQLYSYLDSLGVNYYREGTETTIGYYTFDCLIPGDKSLLIECQGDYWHSLPDRQRIDRSKFTYIDRYFPEYEIMYIWEHEFYAKDRVLDRLKLKLGIDIDRVDFKFSDVDIRECDPKNLKSFLDAYHYIGKGRGGKTYGAYLGDVLIGCCVFSPPVRQNLWYDVELSRFCIHPSYHKKNFASWLISKSIKKANLNKLLVAYADSTIGHIGTIYKASGFVYNSKIPPDYWYVDQDGYVMHKKTLYRHARSLRLTEREFAEKNGYIRKYGGPKYCYVRDLRNES